VPAIDPPETSIRWTVDADRIVTLTMDDPHQKVNTMNALFARSFADTIQRIYDERSDLAGVILRSAKRTFFAGGDLRLLLTVEAAQRDEFLAGLTARKARMRRLEQAGIPIVAVMGGAALGESPSISRRRSSACPKSTSGCCQAAAGWFGQPACWA
jgi:3-hydroxyacyl-CoA dehydrogenase/enoyl-CoA hydratase/3-hydroxybutyryl-CoA epimerase